MYRIKSLFLLVIFFCLFFNEIISSADDFKSWNSPRDYEPINLSGRDFNDFLGESVFHIFAYSYSLNEDKWTQIPLQIDERDDSSHVWLPSPNNILNENDEVIFMARDMGNVAPGSSIWIDDDDSKNYVRYEVTATDPNDPGKQAYVYFYLTSTLQDTVSLRYMNYTEASPGTGSDIISGVSYLEGHNDRGILDSLEIPISAGGNGVDLLDRQKARATAAPIAFPQEITEDSLELYNQKTIEYIAGKVRVARRIWFVPELLGMPFDTLNISTYYYPYSVDCRGASKTLKPDLKFSYIRQSFDLTSEASGMVFHNNFNNNIFINGEGNDDNVIDSLVFSPEVNWYMITGNQGTILTLIEIDSSGNSSLYFYDNSSDGNTGDGKPETGDNESWGDVGISFSGMAIEDRFSILYTSYYLSKNQLANIGPVYAANFQNPLNIVVNSEKVPVELSSFEATVLKGDVHLSWATVSETNNYGFEIFRKTQSNKTWDNIGFVEGNGTTNIPQTYSFTDHNLSPDICSYRLKQIDYDGTFEFSQIKQITVEAPISFSLEQNYPNPFNPVTTIKYQIPKNSSGNVVSVNLTIYNLLGIKIKTLVSTEQSPGFYTVNWDGKDEKGNIVSTGMYVYRLRAGKNLATRRMVLMK